MAGRLDGKVALITGGSRGIGKATAVLFAREGAKVCVNYVNGEAEANKVADEIRSMGGQATALRADISREAEVAEMVRRAISQFGRIDILVNNAGILLPTDLMTMTDKALDDMFGINVKGTIYCTREVAKGMLNNGGGKIVNVASNAGLGNSYRGNTAYGITKAAVMLLTKRFAFEFKGRNVNVNCVAPGYTDTEMPARGKTRPQFEAAVAEVSTRTMLNRIGRPEEIADAIMFFATEESSFVTGQTLVVDGGRMDYLSHGI